MADIEARWNAETQTVDWRIEGGSLAAGADLETAVVLSLFTWARAKDDDILPDGRPAKSAQEARRGWWGNYEGERLHGVREIGSRLWLLEREVQSEAVRNRAIAYAREALQWLVTDGVAGSLAVGAEFPAQGRLSLHIVIRDVEGLSIFDRRFAFAWSDLARS